MKTPFLIFDEFFKSRIHPDEFIFPTETNHITACKNSTAAFQVYINSNKKNCRVNTGKSNSLPNQLGKPLFRTVVKSEFNVKQYAEGYLADEGGILTADILYSNPIAEYEGSTPPVIYVEVEVPKTAKAGLYKIEVALYMSVGAKNETKLFDKTITLEVKDFIMPDPKDYKYFVDLWQQNSNVARYYGVEPWSDEHFIKLEPIIKSLADLGQKSLTVVASDCPWRGWFSYLLSGTPANLFEYSIIDIARDESGKFEYDFSKLMRYIKLGEKYNINQEITIYGLAGIWKLPMFDSETVNDCPENLLIRYLDKTDGSYKYMLTRDDVTAYIKALFDYLKQNGLSDKIRIGADEPSDTEAFKNSITFLKELVPNAKFKMAIDKTKVIHEFNGIIDDYVASFPCTTGEFKFLKEYQKQNPSNRILWYVCNIPDKPNTVLKSSLIESLALGVLGYLFGFDGFLRWAYTAWTINPSKDIRYNNLALPAGDICFIYPSSSGGIDLSLRYKALKRGIETFELLNRLSVGGEKTAADNAAYSVILNKNFETFMQNDRLTNEGIFSTDIKDYLTLKNDIIDALIKSKITF